MTKVTGDLLSATSLVVTAVALLYASWYPDTQAARDLPKPRFRADRESEIHVLRSVLRMRAIPLAVAATAMTGVLAPTALAVCWQALVHGWGHNYDTLRAVFVVVWCLSLLLAIAALNTVRLLSGQLRQFQVNDS
jgi:hypothetical protein